MKIPKGVIEKAKRRLRSSNSPSNLEQVQKGLKGKIKSLVRERGFGFITAENGKEVFFHRSALAGQDFDALKEGASVVFDLERGPKGPWAVTVRVGRAKGD